MSPKRILLSAPHMAGTEKHLVVEAIESGFVVPMGPMLDAFEAEFAEYTGLPHCLAVSSGTAAMHLALRHLGIGPGDEVLASTLTFIASVSPVTFLGGELTFIDSDRATWNMDPDLLAEVVAERAKTGRLPKAVVPTDLFGQPCDLVRIRAICEPYGIPVVADSAESLGATYSGPDADGRGAERHAGTGATAAVYSFNGNKIITTSGGGMLASDDAELIAHARKLATQAREPVPYYEHKEIGYNYRMSNILAAIGRGQLRVLQDRVDRRRAIFEQYQTSLSDLLGLEFMPEAPYGKHNRWLTVVLVTPEEFGMDTNALRLVLGDANIEARPVWKPMHLQPVFHGCEVVGGDVSEDLFERGLCLPSGSEMSESDVDRVCAVIRQESRAC
jgi:dTDP-4-amino-4,6-dideoxygalactose transaminase